MAIQEKIASADEELSTILPVRASAEIIDNMGKKTFTGMVQMSLKDYGYLSNLAKECLVNRRTVQILESSNRALSDKVKSLKAEESNAAYGIDTRNRTRIQRRQASPKCRNPL